MTIDSSFVLILTGVGTIGYAVWRLLSGHFVVNLTVGIDLQRTPNKIDQTKHDLVVNIKLIKGNQSTVTVNKIQVRVSSDGNELLLHEVDEVHVTKDRDLNLSPEEETQFASYCLIPSDVICFVQVAVTGRTFQPPVVKWLWGRVSESVSATIFVPSEAHWRATAVSVPPLMDKSENHYD